MADRKITGFDPAGALTANDIWAVCQNEATGELLQSNLAALRTFVLGGATAGSRVYFNAGTPLPALGVDGDVCFDTSVKNILLKVSGAWVVQDQYGTSGGVGRMRFTSVYGADGLSADGLELTAAELVNVTVQSVMVDVTYLVATEDALAAPAFDEFQHDPILGKVTFGAALPEGFRITIIYSA